jgi:hypothetical protein
MVYSTTAVLKALEAKYLDSIQSPNPNKIRAARPSTPYWWERY